MTALGNGPALETDSLSARHWLGIGLALVTAAVHLVLGIDFLPHWMGAAFLVSTVGFGLGVVLVLVGYRRRFVYLLGVPFTAAQIVLWYALNQPAAVGDLSSAELIDKVAQVLLIAVLVVCYRRE
ncbi:DUF7475 family protein [Natronolimnohabitans innermongolicus]|uniref:Uncharacterized protein n=1 Tax=Natronolimnohabitans innermongolicus JCM 12255 TaxID=1227499 RepID=L9XM93_9EURY|nr:hypothetical protein [Natronolimnohabitans innermongolicus]ELY61788.1 hypothetical protein C493_01779 [Natronolimnohabitans innermongolicus JCM 12255]